MYNNLTPIGGQISSNRGNLVRASKENQCPHCGKPDWCYFIGELSVCNRDQPPATGWEATSKADKDGKIYYARPQEKKTPRPAQTRHWEYPDRDGSPLVRVRRIDFGDGRKKDIKQQHWDKDKNDWVMGLGKVERASIPVYRYADVQKAIAKSEPIFSVDGEQCADILWELGFAATTSIGGMGKFSLTDSLDLQGAVIVIVPDRDEPGLKDAEKVAQHFPEALWLYPYPESKAWENLPKSQGLDIFDWIQDKKLSASDIKAAIGEKKVFETPPQATAKVVTHPKLEARELSDLKTEVGQLLEENLKRSDLTVAIGTLSQKYARPTQEIRSLYQELEQELEQESDLEDTRIGIEQLLASKSASVKLSEIFPASLADPIEEVARRMNLKPECYALALISGVSRFLKNGSSTMLVEEWNRYRCRTFGYFGALIAESSQMKTPVLNAMITDPLAAMRQKNQEKFNAQEKAYKEELELWKNSKDENKGPAPDAPVETIPYITKATWEGIAGMVGRNPIQGILWLCDELAGFFKSANQYRSGKGSDKEDLLECWSGNGAVVARAAGTTVNVGAVSLSIYGNIQPKVLEPFLGDGNDDNGTFARFDFVQQPPALTQITLGVSKIDINPMLQALYENVDAIPMMQFELDEEARKLFADYYNHCQRLRLNHPKQGMRAMLGKAAEKVGRVATILHCIHAAHMGNEVSSRIPASQIAAAIKWVEYTTQQALSINIEVSSPDALESNLAKIISLAERKGGTVTARDVSKSFDAKYRPSAQTIREWFTELATMNYGEVTSKGQSILFSLTKTSPSSPVSWNAGTATVTSGDTYLPTVSPPSPLSNVSSPLTQSSGEDWGGSGDTNLPTFKSLSDMELRSSGDDGEVFTPSPKTSQSSMMSCTTETSKPVATPNKHKVFKEGDRVVVAYDGGSFYEGVKGTVIKVRGNDVTVDFDKRVRNMDFATFDLASTTLMKI
ncbi:DUF3987 domain-containing protein [Tychonema sp. LEGE 07203]|uniref:DUF3987 domain-containing protein n=1 Tax=Tychonema sp. LEGE 07203 TaxID=1828671 RepID=UPI001880A529|nr:DUF3987 domain-containing protein [Tychonema sp. LEGE 07203]MBE9097170.1 DUF3987 domain-containing protein [Tychonema sp. LEGE 07203]